MKRTIAIVVASFVLAPAASAAVPLTRVAQDTFTNTDSQHRTIVEPDTFAAGSTLVGVFQSGRYFGGGASGIRFATTTNGGSSYVSGTLPHLTNNNGNGGAYDRATDPAVAYDARHAVWLAISLTLKETSSGLLGAAVLVNRSTGGGTSWGSPVTVARATGSQNLDKTWIACDNTSTSPFYGHCYATWDDFGDGDRIKMSTSTDGGLTWGAAKNTANNATGLGGQPVVQPNGTVIVPAANAFETAIIAFRSTNGGSSWSSTTTVAPVVDHTQAGNLRSGPLPTAEIDGAGKVYVAWEDCRFRPACKTDDIVFSSSSNGTTWATVKRVPIDATTSNADHFVPGLAVSRSTSGSTAKLGLTYHFYRDGRCSRTSCAYEVGYIQSNNGGSTWSTHTDVAGPVNVTWIANTSQGRMFGDYISTSWLNGKAVPVLSLASAPFGSLFAQAAWVPTGGLTAASGTFVNTSKGEKAIPGAASDHASPRSAIRTR
jgi:hypothetical protein